MSKWQGRERRKFPRFKFPCLIVLRNNSGDREVLLTHTENIGVGGVCVVIKQNVKMFSEVDIEIDLLDLKDHLQCRGKVVWSTKRVSGKKKKPLYYDMGIEFMEISSRERSRLETVINKIAEKDKSLIA